MALVEIEAGPHRVTAAVTRDAVAELGLRPGITVWALVKSVAFDHGPDAAAGSVPAAPGEPPPWPGREESDAQRHASVGSIAEAAR